MLLTETQLHEIREIIRTHHEAFVVNTLGPDAVAKDVLEKLKAKGLVRTTVNSAEEAYLYGQVLAATEDPATAHMSYEAFKEHVKRNPIPLTPVEKQAVQMVKMKAAQFAVGLGNSIDTATGAILIEADAKLRHEMKTVIKTKVAENIAKRETVKKLKSDLGHATKDWARDWDRIAVTEKQEAMQRGLADKYTDKFGPNVLVAKRPMPDACVHCRRLHLGPDGLPKIFPLAQLEKNGSNYKKKTADWKATVGVVHPHCQCQLVRVPTGWGFNEDGDLVPGATGGHQSEAYDAEDESYEKSMPPPPMPMHPKVWPEGKIKRTTFQGIPLVIENPRGTIRDWSGGETLMQADYGFVQGVRGDDGDELDVYVGPKENAEEAYVIAQQNPKNGLYDEMKVMLGFGSLQAAESMYQAHYDRMDFIAFTTPMSMEAFKQWLGVSLEIDSANGHTAPILAIPLSPDMVRKAESNTIAEIAAQDSRAGGRSPGPGLGLNYFIKQPDKERPPMVEGFKEALETLKTGRDPLRRDKKVYQVAETAPREPHPIELDNRLTTIDNFPEEEATALKDELYARYNRNIPPTNRTDVAKKEPKLILVKAMGPGAGPQQAGHKYIKREWMADHWVYTYADKLGGKVTGHEHDLDRVVIKLPKEKAAQLQAFQKEHGLSGNVIVGSKHAMISVTKLEADKLRASAPKALPKTPKVSTGGFKPAPTKKAADVKRLGDMATVSASSMQLPQVKAGTLQRGQELHATVGGKEFAGKLQGINQDGMPVVLHAGERRVLGWDKVKPAGEAKKPTAAVEKLPPGTLVKASPHHEKLVNDILNEPVVNGKSGIEFVKWLRGKGQETYLVGGIVRDMLAGTVPGSTMSDADIAHTMKDVDIVSTASPKLGKQMFDQVSGGGILNDSSSWGVLKASTATTGLDFATIASGGTFGEKVHDADLGRAEVPATFDHDLDADIKRRDFACNSLFYDPVNHVIIDPSGNGIADAQNKVLRLCTSPDSEEKNNRLSMRFWKFRMRGFHGEEETTARIQKLAATHIAAMKPDERVRAFSDIVMQKGGTVAENMDKLKAVMAADGCSALYEKYVKPLAADIAKRANAKRKGK